MTDTKVTQEDREKAADTVKTYRDNKNGNWQKRIRDGECDDGEMVQAFTRHRIESQRPLLEALELLTREAELAGAVGYGWKKARQAAKGAIKQAKGE